MSYNTRARQGGTHAKRSELETQQQLQSQLPQQLSQKQAEMAPTKATLKQINQQQQMEQEVTVDAKSLFKQIKKVGLPKVNMVVKRRRLNARLHKLLQPKNATMILNELLNPDDLKFTVTEAGNQLFFAHAHFNGKISAGHGSSKMAAKHSAAENAFKAFMLEKIAEDKAKKEAGDEVDGSDASHPEKELPWGSLACFALYKLFEEWQTPEMLECPGTSKSSVNLASFSTPEKSIPSIIPDKSPLAILNEKKPGLKFVDVDHTTNEDNTHEFTVSVEIDGKVFKGSGKSKKEAKRQAAIVVLQELGIQM